MHNISKIYDILPIKCGDKELDFLTYDDINSYSKILKSKYYNRYLDKTFDDYSLNKVKKGLTILVNSYNTLSDDDLQVKLLLKKNNLIYGGVTLEENLKDIGVEITLGYWIAEKYQGQGLGTEMIKELIKGLETSEINIRKIICVVQKSNKASARLLEKANFKMASSYESVKDINLVYVYRVAQEN